MRPLKMIAAAIAMGMGGAAGAAQDGTEEFSAAYQACVTYGERNATTAIPLAECNARELRRQDARLNAAYRAAMARSSPSRRVALRRGERAWIVERDYACGRDVADGRDECLIALTIERTRWLRRYR